MNMIKTFESRVSEALGAGASGRALPISFKKLAKRAAKEMESETFVIDGVDTAPALYTVLVSGSDDAAMRSYYREITEELVVFVEQQAHHRHYKFIGKPLARFMVDPSLRSGKFAVFAENIDAQTLERLRVEEEAFLSGHPLQEPQGADVQAADSRPQAAPVQDVEVIQGSGAEDGVMVYDQGVSVAVESGQPAEPYAGEPYQEAPAGDAYAAGGYDGGGYADDQYVEEPYAEAPYVEEPYAGEPPAAPGQGAEQGAAIASQVPAPEPQPLSDNSAGLQVIPSDYVDPKYDVAYDNYSAGAQVATTPVNAAPAAPAPVAQVPVTQRRSAPMPSGRAAQAPAQGASAVSCTLIDQQSGRTYVAKAPSTFIGRERRQGAIILRDPNVSRCHCELSFDGRSWHIMDLNSTNGTLVNDVDVEECELIDGDVITIGLVNLEFRES